MPLIPPGARNATSPAGTRSSMPPSRSPVSRADGGTGPGTDRAGRRRVSARTTVQHPVGHPDRGTGLGRHRQSEAERDGYLPRSRRTAQLDQRRAGVRVKLISVRRGDVDVHPGHSGPGRVQQPGGELFGHAAGHEFAVGPAQQFRQ